VAKYGRASVGHEKCSNRGRSSLIFCPGGSSKLFQNVLAAETSIFFYVEGWHEVQYFLYTSDNNKNTNANTPNVDLT
jgi:hypothetical protein